MIVKLEDQLAKKGEDQNGFPFSVFYLVFISAIRTQFDTDDASKKSENEPNPAMNAEGGNAAEVRADIAAKRKAGAVAHQ